MVTRAIFVRISNATVAYAQDQIAPREAAPGFREDCYSRRSSF